MTRPPLALTPVAAGILLWLLTRVPGDSRKEAFHVKPIALHYRSCWPVFHAA